MGNIPLDDIPSGEDQSRPHVPWEISFMSILVLAIQSRNERIAYFEAEDFRKAQEIDYCWAEIARLEAERVERRRAA